MTKKTYKPNGYWTLERCKEKALEYEDHRTFELENKSCASTIRSHGWQNECYSHLKKWKRRRTKEEVSKIISKYSSFKEFRTKEKAIYSWCMKHKCLDELTKNLNDREYHKPQVKNYTLEQCKEAARCIDNRRELWDKEQSIAKKARKEGWLDEICSHMEPIGNRKKRCIYVGEFTDNYVYIGLTCNHKNRFKAHLSKNDSPIFKHIKETGLKPDLKVVTDYVPEIIAQKLEGEYVCAYRDAGWIILNGERTGQLGGSYKYTDQELFDECNKYETIKELQSKAINVYYAASNRPELWNKIRQNFKILSREPYTADEIRNIASGYKIKAEFVKENASLVKAAVRLGIFDSITKHMVKFGDDKPQTLNDAIVIAKTCKTRVQLCRKSWKAYSILMKHRNILDKIIPPHQSPKDLDEAIVIARTCKNRSELIIKSWKAWSILRNHPKLFEQILPDSRYNRTPKKTEP